ncbi:MAG: magnesium and cobalt transport protein CorA [Spirochaetes bacterium GWF1_51_8]|nr:MAG: magnesium and cobalt transport protein CorA [Spirochaetes bacterium GWF1_51_8]
MAENPKKKTIEDIEILPVEKVYPEGFKMSHEPITMELITYDRERSEKIDIIDMSHLCDVMTTPGIKWLNVMGIHDLDVVESLALQFKIHLLAIEDILDNDQRIKIDDYGNYLYFIIKMIYVDKKEKKIFIEQVSCFIFENLLISFQENPGDVWGLVRKNILMNKGKIRKLGTGYLAYSLIDAIVDNYFVVMENLEEDVGMLEKYTLSNPRPIILEKIAIIKNNILTLRHNIAPVGEVIRYLQKAESELIEETLSPYFRDVHDNILRNVDSIKALDERVSGVMDIYDSVMSQNTNQIMKLLTIMSSIFIPLTFIAGVYGMNFKHMPELDSPVGYFIVLGVMALLGVGLLVYFKIRKWI